MVERYVCNFEPRGERRVIREEDRIKLCERHGPSTLGGREIVNLKITYGFNPVL